MNANIIEFYKKVRTDQGLIEALSEGQTAEQVSEIAVKKAAEMGITLETADVIAALDQFQELAADAANDDELTEFELELIAAGASPSCIGGKV